MSTLKTINIVHPSGSPTNLVLGNDGTVGIGATPQIIYERLRVEGAESRIRSRNTTSGAEMYIGSITTNESRVWTSTNTPLTFGVNNVEAMRIDANGNVGIGTASPLSKTNIYNASSNYPLFVQGGSAANNGDGGSIAFAVAVGSAIAGPATAAAAIRSLNSYAGESNGQEGPLAFYTNQRTGTNTYTGLTERMRIDTNGNLLVGTQSYSSNLDGMQLSPSSGIHITSNGGFNISLNKASSPSQTAFQTFYINNVLIGYINYNGGTVQYISVSDYRLKDEIQPLNGSLAKVLAIKPVSYVWKETGIIDEGFIAHELQSIIPRAVDGEKDAVNEDGSIKPQGIDQSKLIVHLVKAIQELSAEVAALKQKIG